MKIPSFQMRVAKRQTIMRDNNPWFVAADVCRALDVGETHVAIRRLDDDEKGRFSVPTPGGNQEMTIINEPGLYSLVSPPQNL